MERLVDINGNPLPPTGRLPKFVDKKNPIIDENYLINHLIEARKVYQDMEVGQREASVILKSEYPKLPAYIWLNTDSHLGSVFTDYEAFMRDFNTVKNTPNFSLISNGDEVDHFMVTNKASTGVYENPISPEQQALMFQKMFKGMDDKGKILAMGFGNHNQWLKGSGYNFHNTWLREFKSPVLNCGGLLTVTYGSQEYKIAMSHMHWGNSRLNPTNACKRMLEHDYPDADILFLGHIHVKEVLQFKRGGKDRIAIIGGCYKTDDVWGKEHGMGNGTSLGGVTIALFPDNNKIIPFYDLQEAEDDFNNRLARL